MTVLHCVVVRAYSRVGVDTPEGWRLKKTTPVDLLGSLWAVMRDKFRVECSPCTHTHTYIHIYTCVYYDDIV